MVTKAAQIIGKMDCPLCSEEMPVKENELGTLNISCPWCGLTAYVKPGQQAHRIASGWIRKPAPEKKPKAEKPAEPVKIAPVVSPEPDKKKKSGFSLEDL